MYFDQADALLFAQLVALRFGNGQCTAVLGTEGKESVIGIVDPTVFGLKKIPEYYPRGISWRHDDRNKAPQMSFS